MMKNKIHQNLNLLIKSIKKRRLFQIKTLWKALCLRWTLMMVMISYLLLSMVMMEVRRLKTTVKTLMYKFDSDYLKITLFKQIKTHVYLKFIV